MRSSSPDHNSGHQMNTRKNSDVDRVRGNSHLNRLTKKAESWKVGVSGVPWLYTDTRLCSAAALLTLPDDRVKSSTSKGLQVDGEKSESRSAAVITSVHQMATLRWEPFYSLGKLEHFSYG